VRPVLLDRGDRQHGNPASDVGGAEIERCHLVPNATGQHGGVRIRA
jgi:hypothetical protein